jgi:hypothetical protein
MIINISLRRKYKIYIQVPKEETFGTDLEWILIKRFWFYSNAYKLIERIRNRKFRVKLETIKYIEREDNEETW